MIREICKAEVFLAQKAEAATADDLNTAQDLLDTLIAHKDGCVGMAGPWAGTGGWRWNISRTTSRSDIRF